MKVLKGKNYFLYVLLVFNISLGLVILYFQEDSFHKEPDAFIEQPKKDFDYKDIIKFPIIVTNLLPTNNLKRYVRVEPILILDHNEVLNEFKLKETLIRDSIITYLNSQSETDVLSPNGMNKAKDKIKEIINKVLDRNKVAMIYFREFRVN